jgi:soluble lytic murein transglycosylase
LALCLLPLRHVGANVLTEPDRQAYKLAFASIRNSDWSRAYGYAQQARDPLLGKTIRFLDLIRANSGSQFGEIAAFVMSNPDWPSLPMLRQRAEEVIGTAGDSDAARWFEQYPPTTAVGRMREADFRLAHGQTERGVTEIRLVWIGTDFNAFEEKAFLQRYRIYLRPADHVQRLDRMLWDQHAEGAHRMMPLVDAGHRAAADARLALARVASNAERLVQRVPGNLQKEPGLLFERMRWRHRKDMFDAAIDILDHAPADLGRPQSWWSEREALARHALANGNVSQAYRLAARHGMNSGREYADAEFLAGWIALRFLREPQRAYEHFVHLYGEVTRPVSLARGGYWAGRAAQEQGFRELAAAWYATGAQYLTTYYGQLCAAQIGADGKAAILEEPRPTAQESAAFEQRELVRIARGLGEAEASDFAKPFVLKLSDLAKSPAEHMLTAMLAQQISRPDLAVAVARRASYVGVTLLAEGYPLVDMPSGGSARGMMQLMPATAKTVAKSLQIPFSQQHLLTDASYNLTLGRAFLEQMIDRYGGSYVLAVASYNAGPARVSQWVHDLGDPRGKETDVIDWVESIPFSETRTYVQRVLENLQVYRLRLGDRARAFSLALDLKR